MELSTIIIILFAFLCQVNEELTDKDRKGLAKKAKARNDTAQYSLGSLYKQEKSYE